MSAIGGDTLGARGISSMSATTPGSYGYKELRRTPSTSAIYETLRRSKELRESLTRPSSRLSMDEKIRDSVRKEERKFWFCLFVHLGRRHNFCIRSISLLEYYEKQGCFCLIAFPSGLFSTVEKLDSSFGCYVCLSGKQTRYFTLLCPALLFLALVWLSRRFDFF